MNTSEEKELHKSDKEYNKDVNEAIGMARLSEVNNTLDSVRNYIDMLNGNREAVITRKNNEPITYVVANEWQKPTNTAGRTDSINNNTNDSKNREEIETER